MANNDAQNEENVQIERTLSSCEKDFDVCITMFNFNIENILPGI